MSENSKKPKTFNVKKDQKLQAKKRKLEAFLDLVRKDEATPLKKKSSGSFSESYKALKDELRKYQTKDAIEPLFCLADDGRDALVKFSAIDKSAKCSTPLFVEDIYHLLLKSLLGNLSPFSLKWAKLERPHHIVKTVVIDIEGLSKDDIFEMNSELFQKCNIFQYVFQIISSKVPFATELSTLHMATNFYSQAKENYSSLFPMEGLHPQVQQSNKTTDMDGDVGKKAKKSFKANTITKLHLLLSPIQLAMEHYPLPQSVFELSNCSNYVFSQESYSPVTADSPMFALDCEMCKTTSGKNELTRVAIVDENLETVFHTLVKPKLKIVNYMTRYSGITESMLRNVKTTLEDVHDAVRQILPSDAILCGQSLNCDLHAMQMIHPYVIDTSVIFNQHGVRHRKTSLKKLCKIYLDETIQNSASGHHPIEDSIATMKLVQLKLKNYLQYGDAVLCSEETDGKPDAVKALEDNDNNHGSTPHKIPKFSDFVKLNKGPEHCGFFERITKFSNKKVCLIGNEDALSNYCLETPTDKITKVIKSNNKKVIKATLNNLDDNNLIISHLALTAENGSAMDIIDGLKQTYETFPNRTLFLVIAGKNELDDENFNHSFCMAVLKNVKSF